jgi:Domain of unknown function (DU1801)
MFSAVGLYNTSITAAVPGGWSKTEWNSLPIDPSDEGFIMFMDRVVNLLKTIWNKLADDH